MDKRGQVTIFIILGIIIVAGITIFVVLSKDSISSLLNQGGNSPANSINDCVEDIINENLETVMKNGGKFNPTFFVGYNGDIYNYLCYTDKPFERCVNYYPLLKDKISKEIIAVSSEEINSCFNVLIKEYERQGYTISSEELNHEIVFIDDFFYSNIQKRMIFSKGNNSEVFENFNVQIPTKASQLIDVAHQIVNGEAEYFSFDVGNYMRLYPEYSIFSTGYEGGAMLYKLKYRETGEEFNFAVRSGVGL